MKKLMVIILSAMVLCTACAAPSAVKESGNSDTMYQVATLQSLMLSDYYGFASVGELKQHGDFGLGTFDALDGEMIVLDGVIYRAKGDGTTEKCADDATTPFCSVTFFEADDTLTLENVPDLAALKTALLERIGTINRNHMFAVQIHGTFDSVTVRSEKAQTEPYKDLNTVMKTDQVLFDPLEDVEGTLVAVYFPDYMDGVNTPGLHFHFISADGSHGGHVMELSFSGLSAELDATDEFHLSLPGGSHFASLGLTANLSESIGAVEGR